MTQNDDDDDKLIRTLKQHRIIIEIIVISS